VADAGIGKGDRVVEVGPGLGSLTVVLAGTGARVLAVERDRALVPALLEVLAPYPLVRLEVRDASKMDWDAELPAGEWTMVSNLPYNVAVPLLMDMLDRGPRITEYLVTVQREVGERLTAQPGEDAYGAVSVRVAYRAHAELVRRIPADVFWPRPRVESVTVRLTPRPAPVEVDRAALFRVIDEGFAERRKTMGNALKRLGLDAPSAARVLSQSGVGPDIRAERLGLAEFARIAEVLRREGVLR
jgi:16S rRNA (adenine1518-N6/adenine1519-N6)-dimethyltransferase